jgi:tight adherence protein B
LSDLNLVVGVIAVAAIFIGWTAIELIGRLLTRQRETIQREADTSLQDMFIFIDPSRLFMFNTIALFAVPVVLWLITENPIVSLGAAIAIVLLPRLMVSHLRKKRMRTFERQLPDALLMISGSLRAGASLTVALESMVAESKPPVSQEFELMLREQRVGVDFDTALKNMEKRIPNADFVMIVAGMRISREVGGNLADILESLADTLRKKHTMEGKIDSLTAQGRMQGIVMTCLPLFLILILSQMEPQAMEPLFHTMMGWAVLGVIGVMEMIGYFFISRIVNIDV